MTHHGHDELYTYDRETKHYNRVDFDKVNLDDFINNLNDLD